MASARLSRNIRTWIIAVGIGVWGTGGGWLIAHYFMAGEGTFPGPHPSEPWWLELHGAFAFLAIWTGGMLFGMHVLNSWGQRRRRWSGGSLFGGLVILIATGYLLYYVGADAPRVAISVLHWTLGLGLPVGYAVHRLAHRKRKAGSAIYK